MVRSTLFRSFSLYFGFAAFVTYFLCFDFTEPFRTTVKFLRRRFFRSFGIETPIRSIAKGAIVHKIANVSAVINKTSVDETMAAWRMKECVWRHIELFAKQ